MTGLPYDPQIGVARHPNIGHEQIEPATSEALDGFLAVFDATAVEAFAPPQPARGLPEGLLVVGDQDRSDISHLAPPRSRLP